jgi:hypothetical protein
VVAGLIILGLALVAQVWLVVVAAALGVIGNGLGLSMQVTTRRPGQESVGDEHRPASLERGQGRHT